MGKMAPVVEVTLAPDRESLMDMRRIFKLLLDTKKYLISLEHLLLISYPEIWPGNWLTIH